MKKYILVFLLALTSTTFDIKAQPPDPGGGGNVTPNCENPPCIPIDGGISLLLIAGAALGGKKLYNNQKS
jgi:hypothetical protein